MKGKENILHISKLVGKILGRITFYMMMLMITVILLLQIRPFQTYATRFFLNVISAKTNHEITLEKAQVIWLDRATFFNFLVLDQEKDTLIFAKELSINYRFRDLIGQDFLSVQEITGKEIGLHLIKHDSTSKINFSHFIQSLRGDSKKEKKGKPIRVEEISVKDLFFTINNKTKPRLQDRLDFSHLRMNFSDLLVSDLLLVSDTIDLNIVEMKGKEEQVGFEVLNLRGETNINNQSLSLTKLSFDTPQSHLSDSIKLYYNGLDDLSHFVDSVSFGVYMKDAIISKEDLSLFIGNHGLKSDLSFDGIIWGTVGDFNIEDSRIGFGAESFVEGGVSCFGLPDVEDAFALADITDSHIVPDDIKPYVGELSRNVAQLGRVDFTGSFAGFLKDFVARGDFITEKGSIHSDINLKIPEDPNQLSYSGNLELKNVDLGAFIGSRNVIQNVNLKGAIKGKGIKRSNANFDLNAVMFHSGFYGYEYDTIRANGSFASKYFKGTFSVDDPNCKVNGFADLDLTKDVERMKIDLKMDSSHLNRLNLVLDTLITGGKVSLDVINLNLDNFIGTARIDSGFIEYNKKKVIVDSIRFAASLEDSIRTFELDMPGIDAQMDGKFKISSFVKDISSLVADYTTKIQMKKDSIIEERSGEKYKIEFYAEIDDLSRYLDSLGIPLKVPDGTFVEATFRESKNANVSLYAQADLIQYRDYIVYNPLVEVNGSKRLGSAGILTNFIFESDRQYLGGRSETQNVLLEGIWFDDNIDLTTSIKHKETETDIRLETNVKLSPDSIKFKMKPSNIIAFSEEWIFNPENLITFYPDHISVEDFEIHDTQESIEIGGFYSYSEGTNMQVSIQRLQLNKANLFTTIDVQGSFDGDFSFFRDSPDESFQFDGDFLTSDVRLNEFLVGNIIGESNWDPVDKVIYSRFEVDRENFRSIDLRGSYYPLRKNDQLDMKLRFDQADLRVLQPFLEENISNIEGLADGKLTISGSSSAPTVKGSCQISKGKMKVNYLNTEYQFNGGISFLPDIMRFKRFAIIDRKGSVAELSGNINHNSFSDLLLDLNIDVSNFEFLNTTAVDNNLYYGSANGTGNLAISGPLNDILIKAAVRTDVDTRFFIPVSDGGNVSQQDYITFIDLSDTTSLVTTEGYKLKGLTLDFDIEVTPDAYCELIFDIKTGDIIRGRGSGNLKLTLDTDGEFHMFGPLEITQGAYNFTALGIVNKEFVVKPGSRITWFGDPYNAVINLDAFYRQMASFEELEPQETQDKTNLNNKVPVNVLLTLNGNMLSPDIDFGLEIAEETDVRDDRQSRLSQILSDEQELRRQVISLLFFKRFSPQSSFEIGGGGNIGNSVSEFFSSQVSYLVSQLDENLEVEVDLASLDKDAFNTFQLRLAYTFLDGRLTVTRGGGFSSQSESRDQVLQDIVGDWSVEYSLTGDGRLRAKVFSTANNRVASSQNTQIQDRGLSLRFVHSFNDFRDLLSVTRENEIRRREAERKKAQQGVPGSPTIN